MLNVATNGPSGAIFNQSYNPTHAAAAAMIKLPRSCTAKTAAGSGSEAEIDVVKGQNQAQVQKVELFAVISGHGSDEVFNCCEFLHGNFKFIQDHFSRVALLYATPHATCDML